MNSIVNKNEADALKEMIFRRVRERAQSMTDDVQVDVMEIARDSFVSNNNPFSQIANKEETPKEQKEIGFPARKTEKTPAAQKTKILNEQIASQAIQNNMIVARNAVSNKKSFMGALNFLNSQAAVSLIKTRTDRFEVII